MFLSGKTLLGSKCKSKCTVKFNIERKIKRAGISLKLNYKSELRSVRLQICLDIYSLSSHGYGWTASADKFDHTHLLDQHLRLQAHRRYCFFVMVHYQKKKQPP